MILFLGTAKYRSAIYQFGRHVYDILDASTKYPSVYAEVDGLAQYRYLRDKIAPDIIIYNYHYIRMPWLTRAVLDETKGIAHISLHHEAHKVDFGYYLFADPTLKAGCHWRYGRDGGLWCRIGRPIPEYTNNFKPPAIPTIGSFGIGVGKKNYELLIAKVNANFNRAIININIPGRAKNIDTLAKRYRAHITKSGVHLTLTHSFMSEPDLLDFLGKNTINVFHYQDSAAAYPGISSAIDYALAAKRPIAVTKANQLRHIWSRAPEICLENHTLPQIIAMGTAPLQQFYKEWAKENVLRDIEVAIDGIMRNR